MTDTMERLECEIRFSNDESRQTPGRVTGTLIVYEKRAGDRPELFERDAIHWPDLGIVINEMHQRNKPILRVIPFLDGDELRIDGVLPDTQRGRDAATNIREHVYTGLSLEFKAEREHRRNGLRAIQRAWVPRAGLVDSPAYTDSLVEVRAKDMLVRPRSVYQWL